MVIAGMGNSVCTERFWSAITLIVHRTTVGEASEAETAGDGSLEQDPNLRFPYNFPEPGTTPQAGGVMRVAGTWDTSTMDPTRSAAGGAVTVPNMVYNRLVGIQGGIGKSTFKVVIEPELASSWERSPDGLTWTFNIRDDVNWQNVAPLNGRRFVAEDLRLAFDRYMTEGVHRSYWVNVDSVEAPDDTTFIINMSRATADFIVPLGSRYQTIFPSELVANGDIESKVIGTGPMILTEAVPGDHVTFEKNPDYWEREVLLDGFEFKIMPDHSSRLAGFRAGQFDYAYALAASMQDIDVLLTTNPDVQINHTPLVNQTTPFGMNLANPVFQDERVRRAIRLAIDAEAIADVVYPGIGKVLPMHPWPLVMDAEPTADERGRWDRFDPEEAKQLLAAAGQADLSFTNRYFAYSSACEQTSEMLVDFFTDVGITMDGGQIDYTQFNAQWVGGALPEVSTSAWSAQGFDADHFFFNLVHSESPGNRWRLDDPQVDEWAELQQGQLDPEERRETLRKMWDHFQEQMYWPTTGAGLGFEVYQPWVRGIRFGGLFGTSSSDYDWGDQVAGAWLGK